jgi:hypothetical protein
VSRAEVRLTQVIARPWQHRQGTESNRKKKKLLLSIYLAALVLLMNAHADNPPSQKLRVGCLMMAPVIEAIDEEHIDYPTNRETILWRDL